MQKSTKSIKDAVNAGVSFCPIKIIEYCQCGQAVRRLQRNGLLDQYLDDEKHKFEIASQKQQEEESNCENLGGSK